MKKLITMIAMLVAAQAVFAGTPKPDHCPSAAAIAVAGLSQAYIQQDRDGWMVLKDYQYLDTAEKWGYVIGNIDAETKEEAYQKAVKALESLRPIGEMQEIMGVWMCSYITAEQYLGAAFAEQSGQRKSVSALWHAKF